MNDLALRIESNISSGNVIFILLLVVYDEVVSLPIISIHSAHRVDLFQFHSLAEEVHFLRKIHSIALLLEDEHSSFGSVLGKHGILEDVIFLLADANCVILHSDPTGIRTPIGTLKVSCPNP